jgi:hypothetical protein
MDEEAENQAAHLRISPIFSRESLSNCYNEKLRLKQIGSPMNCLRQAEVSELVLTK